MDIENSKKLRLEVHDINKNILGILTDNTEYSVDNLQIDESINETTKINFRISNKNEKSKYLINENLVKLDNEYYIVKKPNFDTVEEEFQIECEHESLRLKEVLCGKISYIAETAESLITKILSGTGWVFGGTDIPTSKKRHLESDELSVFANLVEIANNFNARLKFSTDIVNGNEVKSVSLYSNPINNGRYIKNNRDLNGVNISYDSSEMVTRLYVYGRTDDGTGREINMMEAHPNNLPYVENFSYFKDLGYTDSEINAKKNQFVKELILRESSLYTPQEVYEFALEEIARLCYPKVEASVEILDLSCDDKFMKTPIQIGEIINVIDTNTGLILSANVVSISRDYENPLDVSIGISNVIEKNSTLKRMSQSTNIVEKIIDSGTEKIHGTYIKEATIGSAHLGQAIIQNAHIADGIIDRAKIDVADIREAVVGEIIVGSANIKEAAIQEAHIQDASITSAKIVDASITNAKIVDLDATKVSFDTGEGNVLELQTLLSNFISGNSGQFLNLTGDNIIIANGVIKDAMIDTVNASKINAGQINTNFVNLLSANGNLVIKDNTIQIKDGTRTRVQIGLDGNSDYSINVWDKNGNLMFDSNGITDKAIKSKIIRDDMVSDTANISGGKLNIGSVIESINNDNTKTLKSSKINVDSENQTLDVIFNTLRTNIDNKESRNLLLNSKSISKDIVTTSELGNQVGSIIYKNIKVEPNKTYTFSYNKLEEGYPFLTIVTQSSETTATTHNGIYIDSARIRQLNTTSNKLVFTTSENEKYISITTGNFIGITITKISYSKLKLEVGENKNPIWSSAPEDIEEKIQSNTTSIGVEQGRINTLISETNITKGQVDTLNTNYSSLNQTVNGISTTVGSHTTSINGLNNRVGSTESSITQMNNQIALKVESSEVDTKVGNAINNVQIGGRNLVLNSKNNYFEATGNKKIPYELSKDFKTLAKGQPVTISAYISGTYTPTSSTHYGVDLRIFTDGAEQWIGLNRGNFEEVYNSDGTITVIGKRYSHVEFVLDKEITGIDSVEYFIRNATSVANFIIKDVKIEIGNKPTDWTPAPEDIDSAINTVDGKITTTNNKVSSIETSLSGITSRVSSVETKASTMENNLSSIASRVSSAEQKITDSAIISTVSSTITEAVNNIEVGGRNLLSTNHIQPLNITNTSNELYKYKWTSNGGGSIGLKFSDTIFTKGKYYVLTYKIKKISGNITVIGGHNQQTQKGVYLDGVEVTGTYSSGITYPNDTNEHFIRLDFNYKGTSNDNNIYIQPNRQISSSGAYEVEVWDIQIEEGNKATTWKPAIEDVDRKIDNIEIGSRNYARELGGDNYVLSRLYSTDGQYATVETINNKKWLKWTGHTGMRIYQILVEPNTTYTWSYTAYKTGTERVINCNPYDNSGGHSLQSFTISTTPTRISHTFTTRANTTYEIYHMFGLVASDTYYFSDFTLVKGNKPMKDWIPAQEDTNNIISSIENRVKSAELKITDSAIVSTVRSSTSYTGDLNAKANQSALNTTNNNLSALTNRVSSTESSISQMNDKIALKVESNEVTNTVTNAINKIEIGGRNLARNTKTFMGGGRDSGFWHNDGSYTLTNDSDGFTVAKATAQNLTSNSIKAIYSNTVKGVKKGEIYTYSVWVKVDDVSSWDFTVPYIFEVYDSVGTRIQYQDVNINLSTTNKPTPISGEWFLFTSTHTIVVDNPYSIGARLSLFRNGAISFKKFKIEKGNKATDWTPAPEDVDSQISSIDTRVKAAELKITDESIISTVQSTINTAQSNAINSANTSTDNKLKSYATTSQMNSEISQLNNKISLKVESSEVDTKVGNAISNIQIGGKNLVLKSNIVYENSNYPIAVYNLSEDWIVGQTYTITIKGTLQNESSQQFGAWQNGGSTLVGYFTKGNNGLYYLTFVAKATTTGNERKLSIYAYPNTSTLKNKIEYIQLEKGNKATDWTPAPEDVDNAISTVDGKVNTTNTNLNTTNSNLSALTTRVSSAEQKITSDAIISTVSSTITNAVNNVQVGGRNLLTMKNIDGYEMDSFTKSGYTVTAQINQQYAGIELLNLRDVMELNKEYIFQCRVRKTSGTLTNILIYQDTQFNIHEVLVDGIIRDIWDSSDMGINNSSWHTITILFSRVVDVVGDGKGDVNALLIQPNRSLTTPVGVEVKDFKLEKGNKATDWTSAPEDFEVGGVNLLRNSEYKDFTHWTSPTAEGYVELESYDFYNIMIVGREGYTGTTRSQTQQFLNGLLEANQTYTLSGYVYVDNSVPFDAPSTHKNDIHIRYYDSANNIVDVGNYDFGTVAKNTWVRFTNTFTIGSDINTSKVMLIKNIGKNGRVIFSRLKLEKGEVATDWAKNPYDVDSAINTVDERVTTTNNKVSTIETSLSGITSRVSSVETKANTNAGNLTNLTTRVATAEQKITDSAITSKVSEVITNTVKIGGRNLVRNADMKTAWSLWNSSRGTSTLLSTGTKLVTTDLNQTAIISPLAINVVTGIEHTLTFKARGNIARLEAYILATASPNYRPYIAEPSSKVINTTTFTEISVTFTIPTDLNTNPFNRVFFGGSATTVGQWIEIAKNSVKLEVGTIKTDFTLAQEDIEDSISSIDTRMSSAETKLTANSLTTTISTALAGGNAISNTKFTMNKDGLTIKNGGLKIQNSSSVDVLTANTDGVLFAKDGAIVVANSQSDAWNNQGYRTKLIKEGLQFNYDSTQNGITPSSSYIKHEYSKGGLELGGVHTIRGTGKGGVTIDDVLYINGNNSIYGNMAINGKITINSNWLYTTGDTGWYNGTWGGGWYMSDSTWIRSYNSKDVYINKMLRADGGLQVGASGGGINATSAGGLYSNTSYTNRLKGRSSGDQIALGDTGGCRIDTAGGNLRLYVTAIGASDNGIYVQTNGQVAFKAEGVNKHIFNVSGTKTGGTMEIEGVTYGMSPTDSPQTLIEYIVPDLKVEGELRYELDSIYRQMIEYYVVIGSNPNVIIKEKGYDYIILEGTGLVDLVIKGQRKYAEKDFRIMGGFEHNGNEEKFGY